ncbi:MAG TPA: hypothetical protein VME17_11395 [Bryobacteraceae bacterium]|nr:hypothetical protein [Bryobacteraceae bacterium]
MTKNLIPNILFSSLLAFGMGGAALQAAPQQAPPAQYQSPYSAYSARDFRINQQMLDGVRSDLDQAEGNLPRYSDSRQSFDRLRGELSDLQYHWDESTYQPRQADDVIGALNNALDSPDLLPRDRDRLTQDLNMLRNFRDSHE